MGRSPDETIETIRDRVDLTELVGRHVALRRSGRSHRGLCPFHDEKTPSFYVNPDRHIFHCYGCGASGDVFEFLMRREGLSFREAAESAARDCGVEIPVTGGGASGETSRLVEANVLAQDLYRSTLASREGAAARAYLERRGLDAATCEELGVGFAPDRWDAVVNALSRARIPARLGERAGLLAARRSGGHYDRLRGRITFPIQDARGRVVGFGGRAVRDDQQPKYLNSPETPLFRKRQSLYGLPFALESIRRRGRAVVVEGYFDRIALHRAGIEESLATCGTALSSDHGMELRRRTGEVVLLFDGDEAGRRAVRGALEVLLPAGLRVRVATFPAGDDPDSFLAREGAEALRALVDAAEPALEPVIREAVASGVATPFEKSDAVARVVPLLARITDRIERREFSRRLALAACVEVADVEAAVAEARGEKPADTSSPATAVQGDVREQRFARRIASLLLAWPELVGRFRPGEPDGLLEDARWCRLLALLAGTARAGGAIDVASLASELAGEERAMLLELACIEETSPEPELAARILDDTLNKLRSRRSAEAGRALTRRLAEGRDADPRELLEEKQRQLERRRADLGLDPHPPARSGEVELMR
jgi:DNA primase